MLWLVQKIMVIKFRYNNIDLEENIKTPIRITVETLWAAYFISFDKNSVRLIF